MKGKLYQDMMYFQAFLYDVDKLITEIKGLSEEMTVKGPEVTSNIQSAILLKLMYFAEQFNIATLQVKIAIDETRHLKVM